MTNNFERKEREREQTIEYDYSELQMILMYHNIAENALTKWYVRTKTFDRQMAYLKAYDVVYLSEYDPRNPQQVVITFDDGYSNVVEYIPSDNGKMEVSFSRYL